MCVAGPAVTSIDRHRVSDHANATGVTGAAGGRASGTRQPAAGVGLAHLQPFGLPAALAPSASPTLSLAHTTTVAGTCAPTAAGQGRASTRSPSSLQDGNHTGYQFSGAGGHDRAQQLHAPRTASACRPACAMTITNQAGTWFYVRNRRLGRLLGPPVSDLSSAARRSPPPARRLATSTWQPAARHLQDRRHRHTGLPSFSSTGAMTAQKSYTLAKRPERQAPPAADHRQPVRHLVLTSRSGVWAGYWMRASDVVFLEP